MSTRSQFIRFALIPAALLGSLGATVAVAGSHGFGPPSLDPEARHARMLDRLEQLGTEIGLTEAQIDQIRTIAQDAHEQGEALRLEHEGLRAQGLELFTADTLDPVAFEAHRQEVLGLLDAGTALFADTVLQIGEVMTPEQRRALADKAEQFHAEGGLRGRIRARLHGERPDRG